MVAHGVGDEAAGDAACDACDGRAGDHRAETGTRADAVGDEGGSAFFTNPERLDMGYHRRRARSVGADRHHVLESCAIRQLIGRQDLGSGNSTTGEH